MFRYLLNRALLALPTLLIVAVAVFALVRLVPGDPAQVLMGDAATPEQLAARRAVMGLDSPLPEQFARWIVALLHGDFGTSLMTKQPIGTLLLDRFMVSAPIVIGAVALALFVAVLLGMTAARNAGRAVDVAIVTGTTILLSVPSFWMGLLFILVFGLWLDIAPVVGFVPLTDNFAEGLGYLVLPTFVLALSEIGILARLMRSSTMEVQSQDYVLNARAKGLDEDTVYSRHIFPNAFMPTLTMAGLILGNLLGGIAVIETVFTLPGFGRLMVDAVLARDYPVIQACLLLTAFLYIVVNLLVDLIYPIFDPRIGRQ